MVSHAPILIRVLVLNDSPSRSVATPSGEDLAASQFTAGVSYGFAIAAKDVFRNTHTAPSLRWSLVLAGPGRSCPPRHRPHCRPSLSHDCPWSARMFSIASVKRHHMTTLNPRPKLETLYLKPEPDVASIVSLALGVGA